MIIIETPSKGYSVWFGANRLTITSNKLKYFITMKNIKMFLLKWMMSQSTIKQSPLLRYCHRLQGFRISRSVSTPALGQDRLLWRSELQLERVGDRKLQQCLRGLLHTIRAAATIWFPIYLGGLITDWIRSGSTRLSILCNHRLGTDN